MCSSEESTTSTEDVSSQNKETDKDIYITLSISLAMIGAIQTSSNRRSSSF